MCYKKKGINRDTDKHRDRETDNENTMAGVAVLKNSQALIGYKGRVVIARVAVQFWGTNTGMQ